MNEFASLLLALSACVGLRRSQYWSEGQWVSYRERRLRETLAAAIRIPFYSERLGFDPRPEDLDRLPILGRAEVRDLAVSVQGLHPPGTRFESKQSSGSTGMPAEFLFDQAHQRGRFGARARYLLSHGWTPLHRSAWVIFLASGTPDAGLIGHPLLRGARFLSLFTPIEEQVSWLERLNPQFLYTLPSTLDALADRLSRSSVPSLRLAMTSGEVVEEALREKVRRNLGIEIADNYGSTEAFLAWRCPRGSYHVNAEHVLLQIVDPDGHPARDGELGRVLVTTLENRLMPLVRYEIGDYAQMSGEACPCGRTLPVLGRIAGRAVQLFQLTDGRLITPWELVVRMRRHWKLRQFQIVQRAVDTYLLRYVSDDPLPEPVRAELAREFETVIPGGIRVDFEQVERIPRTATGKFLTAISELAE
jgi:phenylacetate-CoA ligase